MIAIRIPMIIRDLLGLPFVRLITRKRVRYEKAVKW